MCDRVSRFRLRTYPYGSIPDVRAFPKYSSMEAHSHFHTRILGWRGFRVVLALVLLHAAQAVAQSLENRVVERTLKNGLQVLLVERHQAPVASFVIRFRAGSVDEQVGAAGVAHMLEHMLFKGTRTIGTRNYRKERPLLEAIDRAARDLDAERSRGTAADAKKLEALEKKLKTLEEQHESYLVKDELEETYERAGATEFNAYTNADMTTYVVNLPVNKIDLWMLVESDRMSAPVLREFYRERSVVLEERRTRTEDRPFGRLYEQFLAAAFTAHPYGKPVIGWRSDIERLTVAQAETFRRTFYAPNQVVMAIVGDFRAEDLLARIQKAFGRIPAQPAPPPLPTREPPQQGERRVRVTFPASPQLLIGYHKPGPGHRDDLIADVISDLLSEGRTSRLFTRLVEGQELAVHAWTDNGWPGSRYDNLFVIGASPRHPHAVAELESAILVELDRLKTELVSAGELEAVRNRVEASFIWGLGSNDGLAEELSYTEMVLGNWRYLVEYPAKIRQVSPEDIQRVARTYFHADNRTVASLERPAAAGP